MCLNGKLLSGAEGKQSASERCLAASGGVKQAKARQESAVADEPARRAANKGGRSV